MSFCDSLWVYRVSTMGDLSNTCSASKRLALGSLMYGYIVAWLTIRTLRHADTLRRPVSCTWRAALGDPVHNPALNYGFAVDLDVLLSALMACATGSASVESGVLNDKTRIRLCM